MESTWQRIFSPTQPKNHLIADSHARRNHRQRWNNKKSLWILTKAANQFTAAQWTLRIRTKLTTRGIFTLKKPWDNLLTLSHISFHPLPSRVWHETNFLARLSEFGCLCLTDGDEGKFLKGIAGEDKSTKPAQVFWDTNATRNSEF